MKKSLFALCACALIFAACKQEPLPVPTEINLAQKTEYQIPLSGTEDLVIPFTASKSWTASLKTAVDWLIISPQSGDAGECEIKVVAKATKAYESREAVIVIKSEDITSEITLVQGQVDNCTLLTTAGAEFGPEGGSAEIKVKTNIDWFVIVPDEDQDWIHLVSTKAYAEESVKLNVDSYSEIKGERTSKLYVVCGNESATYTITQTGPIFELVSSSAALDEKGGSVTIEVNTDAQIEWSLDIPEDAQSWIHLGEKVGNTVNVTVDPYGELDGEREAELEIAASGIESLVFTVSQDGPSSHLWHINPSVDLEGFDPTVKSSISSLGENLLVSNGTKVYVLKAATGEFVNKIDLPEGVSIDRLVIDDAGNVLASVDAVYSWEEGVVQEDLVIYKVDINTLSFEPFISYNLGNLWCSDTGNIRVAGDITKQAEIVATVAGSGYCLVWHVTDGVPSTWYYANTPYAADAVNCSCAAPAGPSIEDGLYFIGYKSDYNLYYLDTFVPNNKENVWTTAYVTGSTWMENYNCIDVAEFNGTQYVGIVAGCHFNYDATDVYILDASDKANMEPVLHVDCDSYVSRDGDWANLNWTEGGAYSDIILVPTESALFVAYIDTNFNVLGVSRWF